MTPEQLDEIEARAAKATKGPWFVHDHSFRSNFGAQIRTVSEAEYGPRTTGVVICGNYDYEEGGVCSSLQDANFICGARTDVPALVAEVRRLLERVRYLEEVVRDGGAS